MIKRKQVRTKGKIQLSKYFQKLNSGERVSVVRELSVNAGFPKTLQGRTGTVENKRGSAYVVEFKMGKKDKRFIIHPVHLKKLK